MSETVASAGTTAGPKVATPVQIGFLGQLVLGPGGIYDESALVFLVAQAAVLVFHFINGIINKHFDPRGYVEDATGLLIMHQVGIRARGQGQ